VDSLITEIVICTRELENLDIDPDSEGHVLKSIVKEKLDREWLLEWSRYVGGKDSKPFSELIKFLQNEYEIRKTAFGETGWGASSSDREYRGGGSACALNCSHDSPRSQKSKFHTEKPKNDKKDSGNEKRMFCVFCDSNEHDPVDCKKELSAEEYYEKVKENGCCFRCAKKGHRISDCFYKKKCYNCKKKHIAQLCRYKKAQPDKGNCNIVVQKMSTNSCNRVYLKTVCLRLNSATIFHRALLDNGCSYTMMSEQAARDCEAVIVGQRELVVEAFEGRQVKGVFNVVRVQAVGASGVGFLEFEAVVFQRKVAGSIKQAPVAVAQELQRCIPGCYLADDPSLCIDRVDILFGEDLIERIINGRSAKLPCGLSTTPTCFGYLIHGGMLEADSSAVIAYAYKATLQDFWDLEHCGITDFNQEPVEAKIRKEVNIYTVEFPWKENGKQNITSNRKVAEKRLLGLQQRCKKEDLMEYQAAVDSLLSNEYAEESPEIPDGDAVSYLPLYGVKKESSSTTKFRLTVDASAKQKGGLSLNECIHSGPSLLPLLVGILLRCRVGKNLFTGDLAKAFMCIKLEKKERDACRFLWLDENGRVKEYRMSSLPFGTTSSPFLLNSVIKLHLTEEEEYKKTAKEIEKDVYVDDLIKSKDTSEESMQIWDESKRIFEKGNFKLRKLRTNCEELKEVFLEDLDEYDEETKILGVTWNPNEDVLIPASSLRDAEIPEDYITKRGVASFMAKMYDPLGLLTPIMTDIKIFLQDLWKKDAAWDTQLNFEESNEFKRIANDMKMYANLKVARWYGGMEQEEVILHIFSDASQRIYASVAYLVYKSSRKVVLLRSKARLGPVKGMSIPRMELMGCWLSSQLALNLKEELQDVLTISEIHLHTDSSVVYFQIKSGPVKGDVFVANRIKDIVKIGGTWHWIPTDQNPADIPTRSRKFQNDVSFWFDGPAFLKDRDIYTTKEPSRSSHENEAQKMSAMILAEKRIEIVEELVNPIRTSKWTRTVGSVIFIKRWKNGRIENEIQEAERTIFHQIQEAYFSEEIQLLKKNKKIPGKSRVKNHDVFLDEDGLMRMGGRIGMLMSINYHQRHPIILGACGSVSQYIQHVHEQNGHGGTGMIIQKLRENGIWILQPKKTVSSVVRSCRKCKRFNATSIAQQTAPLPDCRLTFERAFKTTGVDCAGPLFLADGSKVYMVLFTCMAVRAIHLELLSSMSTRVMVLAIQRFISRRGTPERFISDHGTNFVGLSNLLHEKSINAKWSFIVEYAPWWGGAWERMIGVTKGCIKRTVGKNVFTWEELDTILKIVESIINKRPISYQWDSPEQGSVPIPIQPDMFLHPRFKSSAGTLSDLVPDIKKWEIELQTLWTQDYFHQVLGSKLFHSTESEGHRVRPGSIVLLEDEKKRVTWKLGRVIEVQDGRDGRARVVVVRTSTGIFNRPIQRIYPLEIEGPAVEIENGELDQRKKMESDKQKEAEPSRSDGWAGVSEAEESDSEEESEEPVEQMVTRRGRMINLPERFRD
jgi:hypothetical protein